MTNTITLPRSVVELAIEAMRKSGEQRGSTASEFNAIEALLAALEQPQADSPEIPKGWKLVPVEPTEEMHDAGKNAHYEAETRTSDADAWSLTGFAHRGVRASYVYRAMLAAAPQPPTAEKSSVAEQPQSEQEPVAWMHQCQKKPELVKLSFKKREPALAASGYKARPLIFGDTAQPRQPLTDEQIIDIAHEVPVDEISVHEDTWHIRFARAIERAHKIGGEA